MNNIGERELQGWIQIGNIYGEKYGVWNRVVNGYRCAIMQGQNSGGYWGMIEADSVGSRRTAEGCATMVEREANSRKPGRYQDE